jgi:hypothetical protein
MINKLEFFFVVGSANLSPAIAKLGQTVMNIFCPPKRWLRMLERRRRVNALQPLFVFLMRSVGVAVMLSSCSSGPAPLSIKMYNPETNQTLDCKASDETARTDIAVLGAAVESCAKQLEARGFVRQ